MPLTQIKEIAMHKVPVWQPALLVILLILGFTIVPILQQTLPKPQPVQKKPMFGFTLGASTANVNKAVKQGVNDYVKPYVVTLQKNVESVLGIAQQSAVNMATESAEQAKDYVVESTVGKLLDSVHTLPQDQQDLIKNAICK